MSTSTNTTYRFTHLYRRSGWLSPGWVSVGPDGMISEVTDTPTPAMRRDAETFSGFALPGMPNVHSHAYVRALAGFAEPAARSHGDFWSWREKMYDLALRLEPDDLEAIAGQAFMEMTKAGFTSVGEFHYLHHAPDGTAYADRAELSRRLIRSAEAVVIGLTLLPALYMHGGVGAPLESRQRRFASASVDQYLALLESLVPGNDTAQMLRVGAAPHSVRAVTEMELRELTAGLDRIAPDAPVHIHLSEQRAEVEDSLTRRGERPGEWLARHVGLSPRWTLVHATHCDADELATIARSGAIVALCPVTEANLGDGLFPLRSYESAGGRWSIGSDSNTVIGPALELAVLEYGQRIAAERRDVHDRADASTGELLFTSALESGAGALAQPVGAIEPGKRADIAVFATSAPAFIGHGPETFLDAWLVSAGTAAPREVMVGGRWVVTEGRHVREAEIGSRFRSVMGRLHERGAWVRGETRS